MTHSIHRCDIHAVGDAMAALDQLPCLVLGSAEFSFLARVPADGGGVEQDTGSFQGGETRRFRVPLVPANQGADAAMARLESAKTEIARCTIMFLEVTSIR